MDLIRLGDASPAVRDVQGRLEDLGHGLVGDVPGEYGSATLEAVRAFQQARGLVADGIVGPDTWRSLVEAGYAVGDRLLYLTSPMLRGDDVRELQERLNLLGFDAGHVDGIFGHDTRDAVAEFQLNVGLDPDGKAGAETVDALGRLQRDHQSTPVSSVHERHGIGLLVTRHSLAGVPILVDPGHGPDDPGFQSPDGVPEHQVTWDVARLVHGRLAALGAHPILARGPQNTPSPSERAALANDEGVDLILSLHCNGLAGSDRAAGISASYFGQGTSVSEHGRNLAGRLVQQACAATGSPNCRSHPSTSALLRESRAVAVMLEIGFLTHPDEGRRLGTAAHQQVLAASIVEALTAYLLDEPATAPASRS